MDDEDEAFDEEEGDLAPCPNCGEVTSHEVLRATPRGRGEDLLVRCEVCSNVHTLELRPPPAIHVRCILSWGEESVRTTIELDVDEVLSLDDEFEHGEATWRITRLEGHQGEDHRRTAAPAVATIWATRSDLLRIRLTMTKGDDSVSDVLICERERTFSAGSILAHAGRRWRIRAIHTGTGHTLTGTVEAGRVRRLYLHPPPEPAFRTRRADGLHSRHRRS